MKRIQYHRYGGPQVMRLEEFEPPRPGTGEVLVRVRAAAANPLDWKIRNGDMKVMTGRIFPQAMGHDFSGIVEAVGEQVTRLRVGDEVLGATPLKAGGAFAEMIITDAKAVVAKPAALTFEEAAAIPTVGLAALQAVVTKGKLREGQAIFVHGCLGGVGRTATQIALARGASVAGSCRAGARCDARDLGVTPIVDFDCVPDELSGQFDIVLDTAGTLAPKTARMLLKPGGRIIDIVPTAAKFVRSALPGPYTVMMGQHSTTDLDELARACGQGSLRIPVARTVPLAQAITALAELERDGTPKGGKLVISMS